MTCPAIVIGLGGTGQWVLTYLKKDLLEIGEGVMPDGVKLLCFDTTSKTAAQVGKPAEEGSATETEIKLGSIKLDPDTEFIPIGDNVYDLSRMIRDEQSDPSKQTHPQIASWYDADDLLKRHVTKVFNLATGSGQVRTFGRMAFFNDLLKGQKSKIRAHIQAAIRKIQKEVTGTKQLEMIIIASFAGGTGAGMFIDMGILARHEASLLVERNLCVRGFYVLPRVFETQNKEMQARSFAAWRELDRFLMIGSKYGQRQMIYNSTDAALQFPINDRIFDVCYLVDAIGEGKNSMENIPPSEGLFPMVSDVISTIMDSKAGKDYTEYITANLAGKLDHLPRAPYHSAIGAYTIKVPVYYDLQVYAHNFALDTLNKFLHPLRDVERKRVIGVAPDANEEDPDSRGSAGALKFLFARSSTDFGIVGNEKVCTPFTHVVADITKKASMNDQTLVQRVALMNLAADRSADANIYFSALTNIGEDETGKKIRNEVQDELYLPLHKEVPTSHMAKDKPDAAYPRIENGVKAFISKHYGQKMSDGTEKRGKYGDVLTKCERYQVERYRDILYLWLDATLNGTSEDAERARAGKIGYVREALDATVAAFANYIEFFNKVRNERTERLQKLNIETVAANALANYHRHKGDKCPFTAWDSFVHPRAHMSQVAYLQAEQVRIDHRKYDIMINVLVETAAAMKEITERVRTEMDNWVDYLATGDPERQVTSLYNTVTGSLSLAEANHYLDQRLKKVQDIIGENPYKTSEEKVKEVLGRLKWKVTIQDSLPHIGLDVSFPQPDGKMTTGEFRCSGEAATQANLRLILSLGEKMYADLPRQEPVIKLLMDKYPTADDLANEVNMKAEPLYEKSTHGGDPKMVSCYVRIDTTSLTSSQAQADQYVKQFVGKLTALNPVAAETEYRDLPSDNIYRMTIMRSDDLLLSEGFNMWTFCKQAYEQLVVSQNLPAERFQIFPAERNAAFYEQQIYSVLKPSGGFRILHPSVVALLEDRSAIEYFFLCLAYGFVRKERMNTQDVYTFKLPKQTKGILLSKVYDDPQQYTEPDLLEVIDVFVNKRTAIDNLQSYIDIPVIKKAVQDHMNEIGREGVVQALKYQVENQDGIVNAIAKKVEDNRKRVKVSEQKNVSVELEDLADLAKVIYKRTIKMYSDKDDVE